MSMSEHLEIEQKFDVETGFERPSFGALAGVTAAEPQVPARDTFAWTVLSALAGTVDSRLGDDDQVSIVLCKPRENVTAGDPGHSGSRSG